ncbi:hypothetical protein ADILRU_1930 [Leifsonia rubra CMS 76R]|nr:hypothetical protein ADILRU_1930 [Leifsonia rubra CMS 76R]
MLPVAFWRTCVTGRHADDIVYLLTTTIGVAETQALITTTGGVIDAH